jgi:uncharacterized protein YqhQ
MAPRTSKLEGHGSHHFRFGTEFWHILLVIAVFLLVLSGSTWIYQVSR